MFFAFATVSADACVNFCPLDHVAGWVSENVTAGL